LCGYPPFYAEPDEPDTDATILKKILKCQYTFHGRAWNHVTDEAKDFIRALLNPDPLKRPTCEEAMLLPWLSQREHLKKKMGDKADYVENEFKDTEEKCSHVTCIPKKWSLREIVAFSFSMLVILLSYATLILYIFKVDIGLWSFLVAEWGIVHNETTRNDHKPISTLNI
jgi:serine/threonine protein kinase